MTNDLPNTYGIRQMGTREWAVTYEPEEKPLCYVPARPNQPPEDAKHRAAVIADIMNATVDMSSLDIRELLSAYEEVYSSRHHADWRGDTNA